MSMRAYLLAFEVVGAACLAAAASAAISRISSHNKLCIKMTRKNDEMFP